MPQFPVNQFMFIDLIYLSIIVHHDALMAFLVHNILLTGQLKVNILIQYMHDQDQLVQLHEMDEHLERVKGHFHNELILDVP